MTNTKPISQYVPFTQQELGELSPIDLLDQEYYNRLMATIATINRENEVQRKNVDGLTQSLTVFSELITEGRCREQQQTVELFELKSLLAVIGTSYNNAFYKPCACRSYNTETGAIPETVLTPPDWLKTKTGRETICVDACIVNDIQKLWDAGIETWGSCCGHATALSPTVIVGTVEQEQQAKELLGDRFVVWSIEHPKTLSEFTNELTQAAEAHNERMREEGRQEIAASIQSIYDGELNNSFSFRERDAVIKSVIEPHQKAGE